MKKLVLAAAFVGCVAVSNAQVKLGETLNKAKEKVTGSGTGISNTEIGNALKEALNKGVREQVSKLTAVDGFFGNQAVKILFPPEAQKAEAKLRQIGLGNEVDKAILLLNRAAEDAVKEATPIFVDAITKMTVADAMGILKGNDSAATTYLQKTTNTALYGKFSPIIKTSLSEVGADAVWEKLVTKYNSIPLVTKLNPDLTDYVTNKALEGVFKMIAVEEKNIRTNLASRTSELLKKVFALQD